MKPTVDQAAPVLREQIASTLTQVIAKVGFLPDEFGGRVKALLKSTNALTLIQLAIALENSYYEGSYANLEADLAGLG